MATIDTARTSNYNDSRERRLRDLLDFQKEGEAYLTLLMAIRFRREQLLDVEDHGKLKKLDALLDVLTD